jgi:D-alanine-D-alanine ligase-like ATP-grasp enzyme
VIRIIYPNIKRSILEIVKLMSRYVTKNKYLLIGADFIIDNGGKAWVLEFNTYPNFFTNQTHMQPTITQMLSNTLRILMGKEYEKRRVDYICGIIWHH